MKKFSKAKLVALSIFLGFFVGGIALAVSGFNPIEGYKIIFEGIFARPKYISWTIIRATPIILTGLGVAFAFKTGTFNIGAEGQFIMGSLVAALTGYFLNLPPVLHVLVALVFGVLVGALWGGMAGFFKAKFGVNEVISTIMLNWIALYFNNFMVNTSFFHRPNSDGSYSILPSASMRFLSHLRRESTNPIIKDFFSSPVNLGFVVAVLTALVLWWLLNKTSLGYQLKAVGLNPDAAEYGGIHVPRNLTISMAISGAVCALGGAVQVLGVTENVVTLAVMEGNGFNGIAVALLAYNHPIGSIFSGLFFGGLLYGGGRLQQVLQAPYEIVQILLGSIVLFIAMPLFIKVLSAKWKNWKQQKGGSSS